jgi:hypothetical protein
MFPGRRYLAQVNRGTSVSVTSERQIAANRRNACESGGPRSWAGKQRARRNAYRHGLSISIGTSPESAKQLDNLARKIALETATALKRARAVAEAELDLARVRRAKVSLIERVWTFGDLDSASPFSSPAQAIRLLKALERDRVARSEPIDCSASTPPDKLFAVNVRAPFFLVQQLLPIMSKGSSIGFHKNVLSNIQHMSM